MGDPEGEVAEKLGHYYYYLPPPRRLWSRSYRAPRARGHEERGPEDAIG
jgi:hypothetical protein